MALFNDFDVNSAFKAGRAKDLDGAVALSKRLSERLNCYPLAHVESGYGLHSYHLLDPQDPAWTLDTPEKRAAAVAIYRRVYRLALTCAYEEGWDGLDNVSELARVARVPRTRNYKDPDHPMDVSAPMLDPLGPHTVLGFDELSEILDAHSSSSTRRTPRPSPARSCWHPVNGPGAQGHPRMCRRWSPAGAAIARTTARGTTGCWASACGCTRHTAAVGSPRTTSRKPAGCCTTGSTG